MRGKGFKTKQLFAVLFAGVILLTVPYLGQAVSSIQKQLDLIQEIHDLVAQYHIHEVDSDVLMKGAINGMLETLDDPYTTYFTEEEYTSFTNQIDGTFTGIGIHIEEKDGYITVQSPIPGSPAEKAGIQAGDLIIKVDGADIKGKTTEEVAGLIKGKEGTSVTLTVLRGNQTLNLNVERAKISLPIIESEMITKKIGYIRLYTFSSQAVSQFKQQIDQLEKQGMEKLILDLRGNPGGYLDSALEISKNFIEEGPIVYVKNKNEPEIPLAIQGGRSWDKPMAILIDGGSASASEILTGALKDYEKGTIVGKKSFGKGTVQTLIPLENDGYLKLTVSEYFTPYKHKMNGLGVTPDIEVDGETQQLQTAVQFLGEKEVFIPLLGVDWLQKTDGDYLALRPLIQSMGGKIIWDATDNSSTIFLQDHEIHLTYERDQGMWLEQGKLYLQPTKIKEILPELSLKQIKGFFIIDMLK